MSELDAVAERLARKGFYVSITKRKEDWHCHLFNNTQPRVPQGTGLTAKEAVEAAVADCNGAI